MSINHEKIPTHRSPNMKVRFINSIDRLSNSVWQALVGTNYPFLRYEFLHALEASGSVGGDSGWLPMHLLVESEDDRLLAAMPLYLKSHSYGEYVFDWSWAEAYENHGLAYYPKLLAAIPFTPATGQRLAKTADCSDEVTAVVAKALRDKAQQLGASGWHVLFSEKEELAEWTSTGADMRLGCQFHWQNNGYADFAGFLEAMNSKKRRTIRKERESLTAQGIQFQRLTGDAITPLLWQRFQAFYQLTNLKYNRHQGYLTPDFFDRIYLTMRDSLLLVVAVDGDEVIAGALNFIGSDTLYGRYWGCTREVEFLHFETCYYQGIEYCIQQGIKRFDSGAQGEHKVPRGFRPTLTYSAHWLAHTGFRDAVRRFLVEEGAGIRHYRDEMTKALPFRDGDASTGLA